jgi:hypothetical protein
MAYTDTAVEILATAEAALKEIIGEALSAKAYRELALIAGAAEAVAAVRSQLGGGVVTEPNSQSLRDANTPGDDAGVKGAAAKPDFAGRAPVGPSRRSGYPRFARQGDKLLKVAWSKKERQPYEHRAPQAAVQTLIDAIRKRKGEGKLFQAADVLPLMTKTGEEYPSYQSYVALAWLRHVGVVAKMGRKGYLLKRGQATPDHVARHWASLPAED